MKPPSVPLDKILALGEPCLRTTIPGAYADSNGHMNMRWYVALFDEAGDELHLRLGLPPIEHRKDTIGTMDFEHHTHFVAEVIPGDQIAIYTRMTGCSPKRIHYLMFMVNETRGKLASIFECVNGYVDLKIRKTAPYPAEIFAVIEKAVAAHANLDWEAPICGVMKA
jgi:acyl-CoA thioester hydrolase